MALRSLHVNHCSRRVPDHGIDHACLRDDSRQTSRRARWYRSAFQGKCSKVQLLSTLLAIPLNIIGTILIATSNYGRSIPMQYLRIRPPFPLSSHQVQITPQDNTRQFKRKSHKLYLLTFLLPTHLSCCSRCCILCTTACSQACSQLLSGRNLLSLARL
jgi:hypothetical protein